MGAWPARFVCRRRGGIVGDDRFGIARTAIHFGTASDDEIDQPLIETEASTVVGQQTGSVAAREDTLQRNAIIDDGVGGQVVVRQAAAGNR